MSINIVTGFGPRTGTSFVMQKVREAGLPITGLKFLDGITVEQHNPDGYWDINPFALPTLLDQNKLDNTICKVWPSVLLAMNPGMINNVVVLERRDKDKQLSSMRKVLRDELQLPLNHMFYSGETAEFFLEDATSKLTQWLEKKNKHQVFYTYTEDLDINIKQVISFLERGMKCL